MKDIFVDNNIALNLANPLSDPYKLFFQWLSTSGVLVMTNKIRSEYLRGNQNLAVVLDVLTRNGRINNISNKELDGFKFPKKTNFLSNRADHVHIKAVYLSNRKIALGKDINFIRDVNSLPKKDGIKPIAADCPSKVNYK